VRVRCERTGICSRKTTGLLAHFVARPACNSLDLLGPGKTWLTTPFEEPIPLPDGRQLLTLRDAANHITKLSKAEHSAPEWQAAMEALILVAETGGPTMLARIGVMRALNRHVGPRQSGSNAPIAPIIEVASGFNQRFSRAETSR
jgi:hypothetical protein